MLILKYIEENITYYIDNNSSTATTTNKINATAFFFKEDVLNLRKQLLKNEFFKEKEIVIDTYTTKDMNSDHELYKK